MKMEMKLSKNINNSMKKLIIIFLLTLFLSLNVFAQEDVTTSGWEKKDYVTYFGTTDKSITCKWSLVDNANGYQVEVLHVERNSITKIIEEDSTDNTVEINFPRSGHYIIRVRACGDFPTCENASTWAESTDPNIADVDGQPKGWWVYGYVAPAGQITIGE